MAQDKLHKRGALVSPANRFEKISFTPDEDCPPQEGVDPKTEFFKDSSKSIISYNDSPDIGFEASLNPYRGCEHGCVYCYARPTHEYFGLSSGVDFESKIFVKTQAADLLRRELAHPRWKPQVIMMSGVTDCYQPFERQFKITRQCLEVLLEFRNPVGIITKNQLITRDVDILKEMASYQGVMACVSVTSLDAHLARCLEPRASSPANRLKAIEILAKAKIPAMVNVAPIIPGLTDIEIPAILKRCREAGAIGAGYTVVRLPYAVKDIFAAWLQEYFPDRKDKVLNRLKEMREGALYDSGFGSRMTGKGLFAEHIRDLFDMGLKRAGFADQRTHLSTASFRNPNDKQLNLF